MVVEAVVGGGYRLSVSAPCVLRSSYCVVVVVVVVVRIVLFFWCTSSALCEDRTHDLQIMRLTRTLL